MDNYSEYDMHGMQDAHEMEHAQEWYINEAIKEDSETLLIALTVQEIFKDSAKVVKEVQDNAKLFYTKNGVVTEENNGIVFESGLTLKYTKPTQLTEQDYIDAIVKASDLLERAKENYEDFKAHGCVDTASKPQLRFGTTNKTFKDNIALKKSELLKQLPVLNSVKQYITQIEE